MGVTGQIVLDKDGLQTNGKNYKIAAISNKNLEKWPNCIDHYINLL